MKPRRLALALSMIALGFALAYSGTEAQVQQAPTYDVNVTNNNNFPIILKRIGDIDGDVDSISIDANGIASFNEMPIQGNQGLIAWNAITRQVIATNSMSASVAATAASIGVSSRQISFAAPAPMQGVQGGQRPRGPGNPQGGAGQEFSAPNLGINYRFVPLGNGTYGAKLSRYPAANSPAAQLQLEPGDMIVSLDDLPFRNPNDLLNHVDQTTMVFINVRGGQPQGATVILPSQQPRN